MKKIVIDPAAEKRYFEKKFKEKWESFLADEQKKYRVLEFISVSRGEEKVFLALTSNAEYIRFKMRNKTMEDNFKKMCELNETPDKAEGSSNRGHTKVRNEL